MDLKFSEAKFKGPIPYQIAVVKKGERSPILDGPEVSTKNIETEMLSFNDLLRQLRSASKIGSMITSQIVPKETIALVEPEGLPIYVDENSVQDIFIDFRYVMPKAFDLSDFSVQKRMARDGSDARVGYQLSFPDTSPIHVPPMLCEGKFLDVE